MFAFVGFCLVFWLLLSPSRRILALRNVRASEEPLLGDGDGARRRQLNKWLVLWFALSLLASVCWIWFYAASSRYGDVEDAALVPWLWPHVDLYLWGVIIWALITNFAYLLILCHLDYRTTLLCCGITTLVVPAVLFIVDLSIRGIFCPRHCPADEASIRFHVLGWAAVGLAFMANISRIKSVEVRDSSWFALSVAVAGIAPEILWMLNVVFVERGTLYDKSRKSISSWDIFLKRNCHWKVSWTLNSLLRLPEIVLLIWWVFAEKMHLRQVLNDRVLVPAGNFFRKNGRSPLVKDEEH